MTAESPHPTGAAPLMVLCPYCGSTSPDMRVCSHCGGHFDLLSRQRTQNAMGPWFVRDQIKPFHPGCSYATLRRMALRGRIRLDTVLRGPTTRQFWSFARNTPGVAHLLGVCHACGTRVTNSQSRCQQCDASFLVSSERQHLGLAPIHLLPGDAEAEQIAEAAFGSGLDHEAPTPASPSPHPETPSAEPWPASQEAPAGAPTRSSVSSRRAQRRRSRLPLIMVAAAVVLAGSVVGIVLLVTGGPNAATQRAPLAAAPGVESANEPRAAREADGGSAAQDASIRPTGLAAGDTSDEPADPAVPRSVVPADDPADDPAAQEQPAPAADPSAAEAESVPPELTALAGLDTDELRAIVERWKTDRAIQESWVRAAERRLQQLRFREANP
ncbi:MAG: hypothetical protein ACTS22_04895 [Phycisphaerales bacterium]